MYTVDASVWVNAFDQREPGHLVSRQFLEVVRDQALPIIVPNVVLVEVAGAISRTRHVPVQAQAFAIALSRLPHVTVRVLDEVCAPRPHPGGSAWPARRRCGLCGSSTRNWEHAGHFGQ
jgi:predicted nucleic acid-binding protein